MFAFIIWLSVLAFAAYFLWKAPAETMARYTARSLLLVLLFGPLMLLPLVLGLCGELPAAN